MEGRFGGLFTSGVRGASARNVVKRYEALPPIREVILRRVSPLMDDLAACQRVGSRGVAGLRESPRMF